MQIATRYRTYRIEFGDQNKEPLVQTEPIDVDFSGSVKIPKEAVGRTVYYFRTVWANVASEWKPVMPSTDPTLYVGNEYAPTSPKAIMAEAITTLNEAKADLDRSSNAAPYREDMRRIGEALGLDERVSDIGHILGAIDELRRSDAPPRPDTSPPDVDHASYVRGWEDAMSSGRPDLHRIVVEQGEKLTNRSETASQEDEQIEAWHRGRAYAWNEVEAMAMAKGLTTFAKLAAKHAAQIRSTNEAGSVPAQDRRESPPRSAPIEGSAVENVGLKAGGAPLAGAERPDAADDLPNASPAWASEAVETIRKIRTLVDRASSILPSVFDRQLMEILDSTPVATLGWTPPVEHDAGKSCTRCHDSGVVVTPEGSAWCTCGASKRESPRTSQAGEKP